MLKKILKITLIIFSAVTLSLLLFLLAVNLNFFGKIYSKDELKNFRNEFATVVYSEDHQLLGKYYETNRTKAVYDEFPSHLINALVATEDVRFFEHEGVDTKSLLRVFFKSILLRNESSGGGSTISQQLAKNMSGRNNNFGIASLPINKAKEMIMAKRIEDIYDKKDILTLYLNTVSFGENIYGIESAALRYFDKKVKDLTIEESATLVGMLKANTYYNPHLNPEHSLKRRNVVLNQMFRYNYLKKNQLDTLIKKPLILDYNNLNSNNKTGYFLEFVKKEAKQIIDSINFNSKSNYNIDTDGLIITTSLNKGIQNYALNAFNEHLSAMQEKINKQYSSNYFNKKLDKHVDNIITNLKLPKKNKNEKSLRSIFNWKGSYQDTITIRDSLKFDQTILHAGLLAVSPKDGKILAYVGGIDHQRFAFDQIHSKRQLASTFKPILYSSAFEIGKKPCDYLDNGTIELEDYPDWKPSNADNSLGGEYSLQGALINSKNIPSINLFMENDFKNLNRIWSKLGFTEKLKNVPAMSLGTVTTSIYEVANAYSTFANYGYKVEPYSITKIQTSTGKIIYERKQIEEVDQILSSKTCKYINEILQNAINRGTGTRIRYSHKVKFPLAGKTGTSQDYTDAWFVGYNPDIVMVSRVGCDSPSIHFNNSNGSGSRLALPLVGKTLQAIQNDTTLNSKFASNFKPINQDELEDLACEDFREKSEFQTLFNLFKKSVTFEKLQERSQRKSLRREKREARRQTKS